MILEHYLDPANLCIYCLSHDQRLTDEHIIPQALNGRYILPAASCRSCQETINKNIETPLLFKTLRPFRAKHGYRSKKRKNRPLLADQTWKVRIQRNVVPFQIDVEESVKDVPIPAFVFHLRLPPFLALKPRNFSHGKLGDLVRWDDMSSASPDKALHMKLVKKYGVGAQKITIRYSSPVMKVGQFEAQIIKIACGLFYFTNSDAYKASGLGATLTTEKTFENPVAQEVYSAPRSAFLMEDEEVARVFSVCENGKEYLYCAISFLPELLDHVYFFRIQIASASSRGVISFTLQGVKRS